MIPLPVFPSLLSGGGGHQTGCLGNLWVEGQQVLQEHTHTHKASDLCTKHQLTSISGGSLDTGVNAIAY